MTLSMEGPKSSWSSARNCAGFSNVCRNNHATYCCWCDTEIESQQKARLLDEISLLFPTVVTPYEATADTAPLSLSWRLVRI
jgi:hypothetical protein